MSRFVFEHRWIWLGLFPFLLSIPFIVMQLLGWIDIAAMILFIASFFLLGMVFVSVCGVKVLHSVAIDFDRNCDPYQAMEGVKYLLSQAKAKGPIQNLLIDKALYLRAMGKFEESFALLKSIDIDRYFVMLPVKFIYYNNLCDAYLMQNNLAVATFLLEKMAQLLEDPKLNKKIKADLTINYNLNQMELSIRSGKTEGAYELYSNVISNSKSNHQIANLYYEMGQLYLLEGYKEQAKECFTNTVQYGNRLHCAGEAKKLLETL